MHEDELEDTSETTAEIVNHAAFQHTVSKKPFLGGYRNKLTGFVYHHAKVQTLSIPWKYTNVQKFHRSTQTVPTKHKFQQTARDNWTQAEVSKVFLYSENDKILEPSNHYVSADDIQKMQLEAVITIQKYCRCWLAKRELMRRKQDLLKLILWDNEYERLKKKEEADWLKKLKNRKKNPRTKEDFALIFSGIEEWWKEKVEELKRSQSGSTLKASLGMLLDKEVEKIRETEVKRQKLQKLKENQNHIKFLSKAAAPKTWKAYGEPILIQTEGTQRAKALQDLYVTISKPKLVPDDRISALRQLKNAIRPYKCPLTKSLTLLADREIDLLLRGVREKSLDGLRTRIRNLVWQFSRQPAFNPEAQRLSKLTPVDGEEPQILICSSCNQHYILPPHTFNEATSCSVLQGRFTKCKSCKYLENEGWIRKNHESYVRMLRLLKLAEEKMKTTSGIIYLLQPTDIAYMVEKIWKEQSCLSGSTVLKDLEFVRWNICKNWTPWNCLLVTREEAVLHNRMGDLKNTYDKKFIRSVYLRHLKARRHFSSIPRFLPYLARSYSFSDYDIESLEGSDSDTD